MIQYSFKQLAMVAVFVNLVQYVLSNNVSQKRLDCSIRTLYTIAHSIQHRNTVVVVYYLPIKM